MNQNYAQKKSIKKYSNFFKAVSSFTILSMMIGILSGFIFARGVEANHTIEGSALGASVTATPNTGTLTDGQTVQVDITLPGAVDSTDTNPFSSPSCLVNGVNVVNTFTNLTNTSGGGFVDGQFRFTYTVGASNTDRTAGNLPIDCTIQQSHSVHMGAFTDSNTVAIDASGNTTVTLDSIAITTPATKLTYTVGESLDIGGLVVTGTYSDSSTQVESISTSNITGFNSSGVANDQVLTITVNGETTTYTVDINAALSGNTSPGNNAVIVGSGTAIDFPTSAVPSSGTLTVGQTLEVHFNDSSASESTTASSNSCLVNNVNVAGTLVKVGTGHWTVTYTVGASDTSRSAGNVPIDCTLIGDQASVQVTRFNDSSTVAIDASGGTTATAPTLPMVSIDPSSGTIQAGDEVLVTFLEGNNQTDLSLTGTCKINAVDVSSSFVNLNNGGYTVSYTVGASDGERPAGHIPYTCTLGNSAGNVTVGGAWNDGNTLSIDTNDDGIIDNGTNNLGFTISATPSSGTLSVGEQVVISMQDPLPSPDVVIVPEGSTGPGSVTVSNGCKVNNIDVSSSYGHHGNGLYKVTYMVGTSDTNRGAGAIPFDCTLKNDTGTVHLVAFTDNNTVAVDTSVQAPTLDSIAITTPATKLTYTVGESLDIGGLVVTGTYSDSSTQVQSISTSNITGFNSSSVATNQVLTITVNGKTTTYTVSINAATNTDTTRPTIDSINPADGSTSVAVDSNIQVTFSEAMDASTINNSSFILTNSNGAVAGTVSYSGNVATFNPTSDLSAGVTYTVHIRTDLAKDTSGNAVSSSESSHTSTFITANANGGNTNPTLSSIAITTPATKLTYTVGQTLDIGGLIVTGTYSDGSTQVQSISTSNITGFNSGAVATNQTLTITVNGRTTTYNINIVAEGTTTTTSNNTNPQVTITSSNQSVAITIASGTNNPTINLSSLITAGIGTLPSITITGANANNVTVAIGAGTVVTSTDTSWNGILTLPTITTITLPVVSGETRTLSTAIEIGTSAKLSFNKAVRILLPGQAGKKAGYTRSGISFTEISTTCEADTQLAADALGVDGDCKINVGADLVVWTKHFTTFATYTQTDNPSSGSGGGGGGGGSFLGVAGFVGSPSATLTPSTGQVLGVTTIIGCDNRTAGYSIVTGQSCIGNTGVIISVPTSAMTNGKVLGAESFLFSQLLKIGTNGNQVVELQNFLNKLGSNLVADGKFGKKTKAAVVNFQLANNLKADGIVGPATRSKING